MNKKCKAVLTVFDGISFTLQRTNTQQVDQADCKSKTGSYIRRMCINNFRLRHRKNLFIFLAQ